MADTNDGDIKAEIGVVCYLARKATKAQKELESEEEFKFTKLEYAAIYADGSETPQVWAGPVPALYLWESRLTSGILRGDQSLNHWEREGEGNVVLSDDRITRLSILGHQIHLLRKAKPVAVSVPIASGSGSRAHIQPIIKPEPVDAAVPIAPSSEPASTSRRSSIEPRTMHKPFQISGYWKVHRKILAPGEERQPVTAKTLQEPLVFNDCIRLLQKRIEASELLDEQAPFLCLPSKFGDGFWDQLAAYGDIEQLEQFTEKRVTRKKVIQKRVARTTAAHSVYSADFSEEIISWSDIMKECGFPDNNQFKENMFSKYKRWMIPLYSWEKHEWYLLTYSGGAIAAWDPHGRFPSPSKKSLPRLSHFGLELWALHAKTGHAVGEPETAPIDFLLGGKPLSVSKSGKANRCLPEEDGFLVFLAMVGRVAHPTRRIIDLSWVQARMEEVCQRITEDLERGVLSDWSDFFPEVHSADDMEDDERSDAATNISDHSYWDTDSDRW